SAAGPARYTTSGATCSGASGSTASAGAGPISSAVMAVRARADRVGPHPVPRARTRGRHGERGYAGLGRGVVGLAERAEQERLGGRVHDPRVHRAAGRVPLLPPVRGG